MREPNLKILKLEEESYKSVYSLVSNDRFNILLGYALSEAQKHCNELRIFLKTIQEREINFKKIE